jgi:hypothetical protein
MIRRIVLLLQLMLCAVVGYAQHWIEIDWTTQQIDSVIPVYTEVIPLPGDYTHYTYTVSLEYPEFEPLTARETAALKRILTSTSGPRKVLDEMPMIETYTGVSRKKGELDVLVQPVVYRDGIYQRLLNAKLVLNKTLTSLQRASAASTLTRSEDTERYADHSVLSSGKWVKISVPSDGIYCITRQQLSALGFTNPDRVKLYGYGGHYQAEELNMDNVIDDLGEVPLYRGSSQGLLFYGNGPVEWETPSRQNGVSNVSKRIRNFYSDAGYYFLTEGDSPLTLSTEPSLTVTPDTVINVTRARVLHEKDEYSWYHSGRNLYENKDYASGTGTITLSTPLVASTSDAILQVVMAANGSSTTSASFTLDGTTLGSRLSMGAVSQYQEAIRGEYIAKTTIGGGETSSLQIKIATSYPTRLDYVALDYARKMTLTADNPFFTFSSPDTITSKYNITEASAGSTVVWRLNAHNIPTAQMEGTVTDDTFSFVGYDEESSRYVAFSNTATYPTATVVGSIANQDLHAESEPVDMVIIVPESGELTEQAERLAALHLAYDSLRVQVVSADKLYNEFSSGTPDAMAYRRYLKMLYDRAGNTDEAPRYLLLFGDCAWDNRMLSSQWTGNDPKKFLLSFQSEESLSETNSYVMEDYFGLLDDGEGNSLLRNKVDVGVGRLTPRTAAQAKILVDKIEAYMSNVNVGSWKNTICMIADDGNANLHMEDVTSVISTIEQYYPSYRIQRIFFDTYEREVSATGNSYPGAIKDIYKVMEEGALVMNYTGHGAAYCLSHERVLNLQDFAGFSSPRMPLWVTAACDVMPFDGQEENIGETAVNNANGAAIAFYGTARTVISSYNRSMNKLFMRYLLGRDSGNRRYSMGDAVRLSKNALITTGSTERDYTANKLHFALLGDPALVVAAPTYNVVVDSLNGVAVDSNISEEELLTLSAGSVARVSGHVEDEKGRTLPDFTGLVSPSVYDSKSTVTCRNNDGTASTAYVYSEYDKRLFSGTDSVRNGSFSISFPIPLDLNYSDERGCINFYAVNSDHSMEAHANFSDFILGGTSDDWVDTSDGPEILLSLNAENTTFATVGANAILVARIEDADGINTAGTGVGHDIELVIDDDTSSPYVLNNYFTFDFGSYTSGTLQYTLPTLSAGTHTLTLRAWDVYNNVSEAEIDFRVSDDFLMVNSTSSPIRTSTTFILSVSDASVTRYSLAVYDLMGRKIDEYKYSANGTDVLYTLPWSTAYGKYTDGVYLFRFGVQKSNGDWSYKTLKMLVLPRS